MTEKAKGTIIVRKRPMSGKQFYDPDNDLAKKLIRIMTRSDGSPRKTFVDKDLEAYRDIGFEVIIKHPKICYGEDE